MDSGVGRRAGGGHGRRAGPEAEAAQDFFHHFALVNDGDHPHGFLAEGISEGIGVPDLLDEVAPFFGKELSERW